MTFECIDFIRKLPPRSHSMLIYNNRNERLWRLLNFTYFALIRGYSFAFLAPHNEVEVSKRLMMEFGIKVPLYEERKQLRVLSAREFYLRNPEVDKDEIKASFEEWVEEADTKSFNGLYVTGDASCFFENDKVEQLVEYELSYGKVLPPKMAGLCVYDASQIYGLKNQFKADLIRAHSSVIFPLNVIQLNHADSREGLGIVMSLLENHDEDRFRPL